jgi:general secretion pathway protein B
MSYILEALKKSEQSRGHGTAPGIQTVHSSSLNYRPTARSIWPWILIAAVLLNLVVLLYFVFQKNNAAPIPSPAPVEQAKNTPATNIDHPAQQPASSVTQRAPQPAAQPVPKPASAPDPKFRATKADAAVAKNTQAHNLEATEIYHAVDINQLPEDIRNQIPPMIFTAHVYSSDPKQRSVVINGHYMEEGESLDDDFVLKQITSTGVIMDFRGHLFRTNVISGW